LEVEVATEGIGEERVWCVRNPSGLREMFDEEVQLALEALGGGDNTMPALTDALGEEEVTHRQVREDVLEEFVDFKGHR
jgi:hypothetical protein